MVKTMDIFGIRGMVVLDRECAVRCANRMLARKKRMRAIKQLFKRFRFLFLWRI